MTRIRRPNDLTLDEVVLLAEDVKQWQVGEEAIAPYLRKYNLELKKQGNPLTYYGEVIINGKTTVIIVEKSSSDTYNVKVGDLIGRLAQFTSSLVPHGEDNLPALKELFYYAENSHNKLKSAHMATRVGEIRRHLKRKVISD